MALSLLIAIFFFQSNLIFILLSSSQHPAKCYLIMTLILMDSIWIYSDKSIVQYLAISKLHKNNCFSFCCQNLVWCGWSDSCL